MSASGSCALGASQLRGYAEEAVSHRLCSREIRQMTADQFRRLALTLPGASAGCHMGHADFRVGGKIFATLGYPDETWGMVKLTSQQQSKFISAAPKVFVPAKGAWGKRGCTNVCLKPATKASLLPALVAAWTNHAPDDLADDVDA
jgi:hypothetical protein